MARTAKQDNSILKAIKEIDVAIKELQAAKDVLLKELKIEALERYKSGVRSAVTQPYPLFTSAIKGVINLIVNQTDAYQLEQFISEIEDGYYSATFVGAYKSYVRDSLTKVGWYDVVDKLDYLVDWWERTKPGDNSNYRVLTVMLTDLIIRYNEYTQDEMLRICDEIIIQSMEKAKI